MAYTAVRGGADAIAAAEKLIQEPLIAAGERLLDLGQVERQLTAAVDKVMGEGGLYAPELAALAVKQVEGDLFEASFMLRAYRSTLPRFGYSLPAHGSQMRVMRRISSSFRDIPGGQLLGRTRDYTQRLLNIGELAQARNGHNGVHSNGSATETHAGEPNGDGAGAPSHFPKVADVMRAMGIMNAAPDDDVQQEPDDITRDSMRFPVSRTAWLQALARGESGAMVCLAYSGMRGYGGGGHGTIAELRVGDLPLRVMHPLTGEPVTIGQYRVTEVEMTGQVKAPRSSGTTSGGYGLSYGLVFGQHERKAIAMAQLDSSLQAKAPVEGDPAPSNDQEMVLYHIDGIESFGFVEHLKLPHFVTFGSGLQLKLERDDEQPAGSPNGAQAKGDARGDNDL